VTDPRRAVVIKVYLSDQELKKIKAAARAARQPVSVYLRCAGLYVYSLRRPGAPT
jgi:hypothetical protein